MTFIFNIIYSKILKLNFVKLKFIKLFFKCKKLDKHDFNRHENFFLFCLKFSPSRKIIIKIYMLLENIQGILKETVD